MVADKVKEEWISGMCRDYPKLPRFMVEQLAESYASDGGQWLKENKKKGEKFARKQAKKGKKTVSQAEQDPKKLKIPGAIEVEAAPAEEVSDDFEKVTIKEITEN
jgi:hypothetical protein